MKNNKRKTSAEEKLYVATQWQLMRRKFKKHKLAMVGGNYISYFLYFSYILWVFFSSGYI